MKSLILLILTVSLSFSLYSQANVKYGMVFEVNALNTNRLNISQKKVINSFEKNAVNLFLNAEIPTSQETSFEVRLGFLIDNIYTGPEIGAYFRKTLFDDCAFVGAGASMLVNLGYSASVNIIDPGYHFNPGVILGYKMNEKASVIFSFSKPLNGSFGADRDQPEEPQITMNYFIGAGLEFKFN